eukprot:4502959-Karenia_brevis.AAC.1
MEQTKRRLSISGRSASGAQDSGPTESMVDMSIALKAVNKKVDALEGRVAKVEATQTRSIITIQPWGHGIGTQFWAEWHEMMQSPTMQTLLEEGQLVSINDAYGLKVEL